MASNPIGSFLCHAHKRKSFLIKEISEKADQIAFVDGSISVDKFGRTNSGIGGLIKYSTGNLLYIFSGRVPL